jgi:Anti-sigma factor NepR
MAQDKDAPRLKAQIDENLKRVYQEGLEAEVPERFKALLAQLREKEAKK